MGNTEPKQLPADDGASFPAPPSHFVARQPILCRDESVFGYELLFRDGVENFFRESDAEAATQSTLDSTMLMGFDLLCDGKCAFINCTRDVLLNDYVTLLPSAQTVVEILETVPADDLVLASCQRLKDSGYVIALDDFTVIDSREPLTHLADIIKVDFRLSSPAQIADAVRRYGKRCHMLAEKVETQEEFLAAKRMGFSYFQGYFFCRPEMIRASQISANRLPYLRMLQAASRLRLDSGEIEGLIKTEPSLCYRLLRYLNSSLFGFSSEIRSVRHALAMLGTRETRRWVRLVATLGAGKGRSSPLVLAALVRGRFCELLESRIGTEGTDLFLMGIMSLMDLILGMPMARVVENVPLDRACKSVLLGEDSSLRPVYQLMLAQEAGDWQEVKELAGKLGLTDAQVAEHYWHAMQWARQMTGG